MAERHEFNCKNTYDMDNGIASYTQKIFSQIVNLEEEAIKQTLIDYAKEYANEKQENVTLLLIDENTVRQIIDLGIKTYTSLYRGDG